VWTFLSNKRERKYKQVDSGNFGSTLKDTRAQSSRAAFFSIFT